MRELVDTLALRDATLIGPFGDTGSPLPAWALAHHLWTDAGHAFRAALERDLDRIALLPALPLYGGAERFTSPDRELSHLQARSRSHDTAIIPDAGHFFPESAPDATTDAISAWLERTPLSASRSRHT